MEAEEELIEKPAFVIVEFAQLEKLLQRCPDCGKLPSGQKTGQERKIEWTTNGSNMTAIIRCGCTNYSRTRWSTQSFISGTETRTGNLALTGAAQLAPVGFVELSSFFSIAQIPFLKKDRFLSLTKCFVWPMIEVFYKEKQAQIFEGFRKGAIGIAMDGQFDSPGYSAEFCAVTSIEIETKQVIDFAIVHKSETENKSAAMELEGVKRSICFIEAKADIASITTDKNNQIVSYLQKRKFKVYFDPWHRLGSLKKECMAATRKLKGDQEKKQMRDLSRRFLIHCYKAVELFGANPKQCVEKVFSFFFHIQGIHNWANDSFAKLLVHSQEIKLGTKFNTEKFIIVLSSTECSHPLNYQSSHDPILPISTIYSMLLEIAAKTCFISDFERMRIDNITSYVENFHSLCIKYRPKRKYFCRKGFEYRTMLAVLDHNTKIQAEMAGEHQVESSYRCFSKAKGAYVTKKKKTTIDHKWKKDLIVSIKALKTSYGGGDPVTSGEDALEIDKIGSRFEELLYLSEDESEQEEEL